MIKKNIKYYKRPNSFVSNIQINKKDIKDLGISFKLNDKGTSKISNESVILLKETEFNKLNVHQDNIKSYEKRYNDLKESNDQLNNKLNDLNLKLSNLEKELSNKELLNKTLEKDNIKLKHEIEQTNNKIIEILKEYSEIQINLNQIINKYEIVLNTYETEIKSYNNLGFFSRLFNTTKLKTHDKKLLEKELKEFHKKNTYKVIDTKKE
jgi:chromosome segregation ATPase